MVFEDPAHEEGKIVGRGTGDITVSPHAAGLHRNYEEQQLVACCGSRSFTAYDSIDRNDNCRTGRGKQHLDRQKEMVEGR